MKVINLFAGPGSGKSTGSAYIFALAKMEGKDIELIREYAKDLVYEGSTQILANNQLYVTAEQHKRVKDVDRYGVKTAITDSPLLLGLYYARNIPNYDTYCETLWKLNEEFDNVNVLINRVKEYKPKGRLQTEEQSNEITDFLKGNVPIHYIIDGNRDGYETLYELLKSEHGI